MEEAVGAEEVGELGEKVDHDFYKPWSSRSFSGDEIQFICTSEK